MKDKIRVLFVHPTVHHASGPDNSLFELISRLDRNRYEKFLIVPEYTPLVDKFNPYINECFIEDAVRIVSPPNGPLSAIRYIVESINTIPHLANILAENKIDLVHSNVESTWRMGLAAKIKHLPSIIHIRGLTSIQGNARSRLVPKILHLVGDEFIAVSEGVADAYIAAGLSRKSLHVVPNGVDINKFRPSIENAFLREMYNLPQHSKFIGAIGSADPRKGWVYLVMAFALVKQCHPDTFCYLIGNQSSGEISYYKNHSYLEIIRGLVESLKLNDSLFMPGVIHEIQKVYDSLCVVVQPSLTEAGPRVVLESMAMGKPIVATSAPGNSSYLPEFEAGIITPIRDAQSMAAAICELLGDPERLARMSSYARRHVEQDFSIEEQVVKVDRIFMEQIEIVPE